ncbi:subtilisin-like protein [Hanseniaspora valbyensis NRRL Y-1626]|uniref:Subtilisin-like protein n=1 Tax=Hanseniaspora valbyensis NRRL Y-1626 TaxID=766949 RepID=A0A1B7T9W1_9ASCO|nr:subtilisin-like protein [Hanseniaspora valbyensis NRRL Y-1626]
MILNKSIILLILHFITLSFANKIYKKQNKNNDEFVIQLKPGNDSCIQFLNKYYTSNSLAKSNQLLNDLKYKELKNFQKGNFIKPNSNELQSISFTDYYQLKKPNLLPDLNLIYGKFPQEVLAQMYEDPLILAISLNREFQLATNQEEEEEEQSFSSNSVVTLDDLSPFSNSKGGIGVDIYLYDTGIFPNQDHFDSRLHKILDYSSIRKKSNKNNSFSKQQHDHGTNLAAVIGSSQFGIAKKSNLYDMKLSNGGTTNLFTLLMALKQGYLHSRTTGRPSIFVIPWVAKKSHVLENVLSLMQNESLNTNHKKTFLTIVVPGGNSPGTSACLYSPAGTSKVITAGALVSKSKIIKNENGANLDKNDIAHFSAIGECIDYYAPGYKVNTLCYDSNYNKLKGCEKSGTSVSAAIIAGYLALDM